MLRARTITARFSQGVFTPLETAVRDRVKEGEEVSITVATIPTAPKNPLRATAGGWKGLNDAEALKRTIDADRVSATRPEVHR